MLVDDARLISCLCRMRRYNDTCDFSSPELQQAVYDLCADFSDLTPTGMVSDGTGHFLVRQGSGLKEKEVNCWQLSFKSWFEDEYPDERFPCALDNCTAIIMDFFEDWDSDLSNERYDGRVFVEDERIVGTSFAVNATISRFSVVYFEVKDAFEAWEDWFEQTLSNHEEPCMRSAMHVAEDRDKVRAFLVIVLQKSHH